MIPAGTVVGDKEIARRFRALPDGIRSRVTESIGRLILKLQRKVMQEKLSGQVLKVRTGTLRRSIDQRLVTDNQQPALFQAQKNELAHRQQGLGTVWTLTVDVYIYTSSTGSAFPSTQLNNIADAIEAALQPDNPVRNTNTLGGLVQHCRIEGAIETDEGTLGDQAVAIIPIVITAT